MIKRIFFLFLLATFSFCLFKGCTSGNDAEQTFGTGGWQGNPAAGDLSSVGGRYSGTLFGTVVDQVSQKVGGAVVTVNKAGIAVSTLVTGSDGTFQINLATGTYNVLVSKTGYADNQGLVTIQTDVKTIFNIELSPKFTLEGTVKLNTSSDAIPNIPVEIFRDAIVVSSTITTAEGKFIFQDLSAGQYTVSIASGSNTYNPVTYVVQILKDGTISPKSSDYFISINLGSNRSRFTLTGNIRDAYSKAPLEYVNCNIKGYGSVLSDSEGTYYFINLFEGQYEITFTKGGFNGMSTNFYLNSDGTTNPASLSYEMVYSQEKNMGSISGRFVNENTKLGVSNLLVRVYKRILTEKSFTLIDQDQFGNPISKIITEEDWEFESSTPKALKSTHTSIDIPTDEQSLGSFKLTHLNPSTDKVKYFVYLGADNSEVLTYPFPRGATDTVTTSINGASVTRTIGNVAYWYHENPENPNKRHSWTEVEVLPNTSTYLTNYEKGYK